MVQIEGTAFAEVAVNSIQPNPKQPRIVFDPDDLEELAKSIAEVGVLQPVVIRPVDDHFELIMGERRWRASQVAGLEYIPAIIRQTEETDLLRDALLENLHRAQLNPLEEAAAYQQLMEDFGCTQHELSIRIARSRPQIANTLRLLRLPPAVQNRVAAGVLSAGHARQILALDNEADQIYLADRIINEGLSVRSTEELVALGDIHGGYPAPGGSGKRQRPSRRQPTALEKGYAQRLEDLVETRVKVQLGVKKGKIIIEFAGEDDLDRIVEILTEG